MKSKKKMLFITTSIVAVAAAGFAIWKHSQPKIIYATGYGHTPIGESYICSQPIKLRYEKSAKEYVPVNPDEAKRYCHGFSL